MAASEMEEGVSRQQASNYSRTKTFLPAVDAVFVFSVFCGRSFMQNAFPNHRQQDHRESASHVA